MHDLRMEVPHSLSTVLGSPNSELPALKQLGFCKPDNDPYAPSIFRSPMRRSSRPDLYRSSRRGSRPEYSNQHHSNTNLDLTGTSRMGSQEELDVFPNREKGIHPSQLIPESIEEGGTGRSNAKLEEESQSASADRMLSFLSRTKYLYDEREISENNGLSMPGNFTFADQRSIIKVQADRIRNQLELKFGSIEFLSQADRLGSSTAHDSAFVSYNPLQIIRDRSKRPKASKHHARENMWHITISELVEDTRWRFRTARIRVQKQKKKQRRNGSFPRDTAERDSRLTESASSSHLNSSQMTPPRSTSAALIHGPPHPDQSGPHSAPINSAFTFLTPGSATSVNRASDGPTSNLPQSDCTKLIDRLRSSHSGNSEMGGSSSESILDAEEDESKSEDPDGKEFQGQISESDLNEDGNLKARSRFCRNSASVANTWNRLYRARAESSKSEDARLKPLSRVSTRGSNFSQSGLSTTSSAVISESDDGLYNLEEPMPHFAQSFRTSSNGDAHLFFGGSPADPSNGQSNGSVDSSTEPPPVLKLIADNGQEKMLDDSKWSSKSSSRKQSTSEGVELTRNEHLSEPGQGFGSLRPATVETRKDSHERALCSLLSDVRYLIPYYSIILRRDEAGFIYQRCKAQMTPLLAGNCAQLSDSLKSDMVANLLPFLGKVEQTVVNEQQLLDAEVATCLNDFRISTDLMVGDVNTTMNRQIREISSRMERISNCKNHGMCLALSYSLLEYSVVFLMWLIWTTVQLAKPLKWLLTLVRAVCSNFIIA